MFLAQATIVALQTPVFVSKTFVLFGFFINAEMLFPLLSLSLNFSATISGLCVGCAARHRPEDGNSHYGDQRHPGNGENLGVNAPKQHSVEFYHSRACLPLHMFEHFWICVYKKKFFFICLLVLFVFCATRILEHVQVWLVNTRCIKSQMSGTSIVKN